MIFWMFVYGLIVCVWWFIRVVVALMLLFFWLFLSMGSWLVLRMKGEKA